MLSFIKKYWEQIIIAVFVLLIILTIVHSNPKYIGSPLYQDRIDSAEKRIKDSMERIKYYQVLDSIYNKKIDTISQKIDELQIIKPQIRNYFTTNIQKVDKYSPKDIDTFFKKRYKY